MKLSKILQLSIVLAAMSCSLLATMAAADMEIEIETEDEIDDDTDHEATRGKTF